MGQDDSTHAPAASPWQPAPEPPTNGPRVLLAEDDPEMRRLVARALRRAGYEVTEARDGRELVDVLLRNTAREAGPVPDLIISDVRMPGCTGLEVLARLRRIDWETPVILITAFGDEETHEEAGRLGAARVMDKPFDLEDLCQAARALTRD